MSVNHKASVIVGFFPDAEEFLKPLLVPVIPSEDDPESEVYKFDGVLYRDREEVLEVIAKAVDAVIEVHMNCFSGDVYGISIQPHGLEMKDGRYMFAHIANSGHVCYQIKRKLREYGLDAGNMGVYAAMDVY